MQLINRASIALAGMAAALCATPVHAAGGLPIEQGLYADASEGCAKASAVFFYDGANFGQVYPGGPGYKATARVNPIQRTGSPPAGRQYAGTSKYYLGYTLAWTQEDSGPYGSLAVKASTPRKFTMRSVDFRSGTGGVNVIDTPYLKCEFAQLTVAMQSAIRTARPQLAGAARDTAAAAPGAPTPLAPFNIRPGHYLPVAAACGSGQELILYYDGKRVGWIDMQPFNPNRMNAVAAAKRRGAGWVTDAATGETLRVLGVDRIMVGDAEFGEETLRWCPAAEVRASARPR